MIDNGPKHVLKGGIRFNNFSAEYGKSFRALNELNFTIQPGEKVCVVGRTGSGKSTLLLSILDLLYHTSGVTKKLMICIIFLNVFFLFILENRIR